MTELDVQLSRAVAAAAARRHGRLEAWATTGITAAAWTLLVAAVATLLLR
jgi:hypothetical protein